VTFASGSTQPNASTTVAGKVEQATDAEVKAGTETGTTSAPLFISPKSSVAVSAGVGDDGKVVKLNTSGLIDTTMLSPTTNIFLPFTTGEAIDGSTTPQAVYLKSSDGLIYKTVATGTESTFKFLGFITTNSLISTTANVIVAGKVTGFTGLTIDADYYITDSAGAISASSGTNIYKVATGLSTTTLLIDKGAKVMCGSSAFSTTAVANNDLTIDLGFKPKIIEIEYYIQGHGTSGGSASYHQAIGTFKSIGATIIGAMNLGFSSVNSDNAYPSTFGSQGAPSDFASATPTLSVGATGSGTGGITMTLSMVSISNTGFVIRRATASNAPASTARANIIWKVIG
jgi:hypothetical protein